MGRLPLPNGFLLGVVTCAIMAAHTAGDGRWPFAFIACGALELLCFVWALPVRERGRRG